MNGDRLNPHSPFFHEERYAPLAAVAERQITICGAGALGANLGETLARMGFQHLRVIDHDRVEMRNLSTQPYLRAEIGAPKARALAATLYRAVQARLDPVVAMLTSDNAVELLQGSDLIVDTFDNEAARAAVSAASRALSVPCLHVGFSADGLYGSGEWEPGYKPPRTNTGDPCDYPLTRPFAVLLAALAARAVADFLRQQIAYTFEVTWNDLRIVYSPVQP
ncbi:ThiF family adenylyltransferase [Thermogemmatispora sp.]|uniref:ThiF family adenylyltransferase n=1 Tax=Thermogemmatispora sp. TaxID=1968838 RepID=UPI001D72EEA6|nr:ThiF family adenylyltransferase [Thermogemmatispora sp.]MBX5450374.1 ThiF family adenylyltransferase [Thermogemmatispora sp.]